jgi:hypothetical protein
MRLLGSAAINQPFKARVDMGLTFIVMPIFPYLSFGRRQGALV